MKFSETNRANVFLNQGFTFCETIDVHHFRGVVKIHNQLFPNKTDYNTVVGWLATQSDRARYLFVAIPFGRNEVGAYFILERRTRKDGKIIYLRVFEFGVQRKYHGQKVGHDLMKHILRETEMACDYSYLEFPVPDHNPRLHREVTKLGFVLKPPRRVVRGYFTAPVDDALMYRFYWPYQSPLN